MLEVKFPEFRNMWEFLITNFDFFYDLPNIRILECEKEQWENLRKSMIVTHNNILEKQIDAPKEDMDGTILYKETIGANSGQAREFFEALFNGSDFVIMYLDVSQNDMFLKSKFIEMGYSCKDYRDFIIFHELIHALEHMSGKQLFTERFQDIDLFAKWFKSNGYERSSLGCSLCCADFLTKKSYSKEEREKLRKQVLAKHMREEH